MAQESPAASGATGMTSANRIRVLVLFGLAGFLFAAAAMLPLYLVPRLAKTPLDLSVTTISCSGYCAKDQRNYADGATVGDVTALTNLGEVYKTAEHVPVESQRYLTTEDPSNADKVTLQAGITWHRNDVALNTGLLTAIVDRETIDRKSGEPVQPQGSIATYGAAVPVTHTGLLWRFPFDTQQHSYQYFDLTLQAAAPLQFVRATEINSTAVYQFHQTIAPTQVVRPTINAPGNMIAKTREAWGLPGGDPKASLTMFKYYGVDRTLWVEPRTGTLVKAQEDYNIGYAPAGEGDPSVRPDARILFKGMLVDNQPSVESQIARAKDAMDTIALYKRVIPLALAGVGLVAVIGAAVLIMRARRTAAPKAENGRHYRAPAEPEQSPTVAATDLDAEQVAGVAKSDPQDAAPKNGVPDANEAQEPGQRGPDLRKGRHSDD